jgi:hypothetical protein
VRPDTGSTPTDTRTSHTPELRSRMVPVPHAMRAKVGTNVGTWRGSLLRYKRALSSLRWTLLGALGGIRTPNLLIRIIFRWSIPWYPVTYYLFRTGSSPAGVLSYCEIWLSRLPKGLPKATFLMRNRRHPRPLP